MNVTFILATRWRQNHKSVQLQGWTSENSYWSRTEGDPIYEFRFAKHSFKHFYFWLLNLRKGGPRLLKTFVISANWAIAYQCWTHRLTSIHVCVLNELRFAKHSFKHFYFWLLNLRKGGPRLLKTFVISANWAIAYQCWTHRLTSSSIHVCVLNDEYWGIIKTCKCNTLCFGGRGNSFGQVHLFWRCAAFVLETVVRYSFFTGERNGADHADHGHQWNLNSWRGLQTECTWKYREYIIVERLGCRSVIPKWFDCGMDSL